MDLGLRCSFGGCGPRWKGRIVEAQPKEFQGRCDNLRQARFGEREDGIFNFGIREPIQNALVYPQCRCCGGPVTRWDSGWSDECRCCFGCHHCKQQNRLE